MKRNIKTNLIICTSIVISIVCLFTININNILAYTEVDYVENYESEFFKINANIEIKDTKVKKCKFSRYVSFFTDT